MRSLRILLGAVFTAALLTLSTSTASAQVCASLILTTQAQVDAVNCSSVTGNILISGSDITNLDGLDGITSVVENLYIQFNSALTDLAGLDGITGSVGGYLRIGFNTALTNLVGLDGITSVGGYLYIYNNSALTNLAGLDGITSVGGIPVHLQQRRADESRRAGRHHFGRGIPIHPIQRRADGSRRPGRHHFGRG